MKNNEKYGILYVDSNDLSLQNRERNDSHMARQKNSNKASKNLNCKIDKSVSDMLENFIEDTKMSKTATVEKALQMYIEQYRKTGRI